jgi:hypothetical protein
MRTLGLRATPWLDGVRLDSAVLECKQWANDEYGAISGQLVDVGVERPFKFGKLELTGENTETHRPNMD